MSQSFRPVKEIWNVHSSCFIEPEKLIVLLHDLAARVGTASDEHEYGIREGHFARHIRRMRMLYMERRRALVRAIQIQMGDMLEVIGAEAGMHLVALLPQSTSDVVVSRKSAQRGISAMPLSSCYLKQPTRGGLILGYGGANAQHIHDGIRKLRLSVQGD